jgi:uncharacterized membrane protein YqgA involved in biofilm formation
MIVDVHRAKVTNPERGEKGERPSAIAQLSARKEWTSRPGLLVCATRMIGTIVNVGAIVAGGTISLAAGKQLPASVQQRIKLVLGLLTIYIGCKTTWQAINGSFGSVVKQTVIVLAALILGNLIGKALGLQKNINRLGDYARQSFQGSAENPRNFGEGFVTCTILFCVGPMALLGALEDGLTGRFPTLAVKSLMDGLATMAFVKSFGAGPIFAALPVLAYQGSITLAATSVQPMLENHQMLDSINAAGGLLILCISVVILDIQKVPLADYLPALAVAPMLTWLFS